jgi:hypothetical protein
MFFVLSCASTTVTDVWKDKSYQGKPQKILVIMAARTPDMRKIFEDRFSAELENRGNNATQSYKSIAHEQLRDKETVKAKIKSSGVDAVLISRLIDTKTKETYMPGLTYVVPSFYYDWWGYYNIVFADYGYTVDVPVSYIETNVYDVNTAKLIWSGHSNTERTEGEQQLINIFIQRIIKKLSSSGVIK